MLPDIFALDRKMKAALPKLDHFAYVSVVDAVCPRGNVRSRSTAAFRWHGTTRI